MPSVEGASRSRKHVQALLASLTSPLAAARHAAARGLEAVWHMWAHHPTTHESFLAETAAEYARLRDQPAARRELFLDALAGLECELSVVVRAYGVVLAKDAYLRDPWSQVDFAVVTTAWLPYVMPTMHNLTGIRAIRALRPLRTLNRLPGMPMLVATILQAVRNLASVMLVLLFTFIFFGIVGQGFFQGALHYRCAAPEDAPTTPQVDVLEEPAAVSAAAAATAAATTATATATAASTAAAATATAATATATATQVALGPPARGT